MNNTHLQGLLRSPSEVTWKTEPGPAWVPGRPGGRDVQSGKGQNSCGRSLGPRAQGSRTPCTPLLLGFPVSLLFTNNLNPVCVVRSRGDGDEMTAVIVALQGTRALERAPCSRLGGNLLQSSVVLSELVLLGQRPPAVRVSSQHTEGTGTWDRDRAGPLAPGAQPLGINSWARR